MQEGERLSQSETRREFTKLRKQIIEKNRISDFICARCGYSSPSVHLHHITELIDDGRNTLSNLIPLCEGCHKEWDLYIDDDITFGEFLISPPACAILHMIKFGGRMASTRSTRQYYGWFSTNIIEMSGTRYLERHNCSVEDFHNEFRRQNDIFSAFPYSDRKKMIALHGKNLNFDYIAP